jgi:hypothetical protein
MKTKYFLLAAALFVACSDDSSSTAVNNPAEYTYTDCLQTVFDFEKSILSAYDKDYHGLVTDSLYMDKGSASSRGKSIYIYKAYWTGTHLDSAYEANLRNGEWTYQTTVRTQEPKVVHEGNIWTITATNGVVSDTMTIYFDGDSLATTSSDEEGKYTITYAMKTDTIFRIDANEIIVRDENDKNTCYRREHRGDVWYTWNRYETGVKDGMIILTDTHTEDGENRKTGTYFMFYRYASTS